MIMYMMMMMMMMIMMMIDITSDDSVSWTLKSINNFNHAAEPQATQSQRTRHLVRRD